MATVIELGKSTYGIPLNAHAHQLKRERDVPCVPEDLSVSAKKRPKKSMPSKISPESNMENDICDGDDVMKTDIITEVMDIQEPLSKLRNLLTRRLRMDLSSFQIWLQDKIRMQPNKCLGDQCIQSEGLAQVKVELKQHKGSNRINILDVLKYPEDSGSEGGDDYDAVVDEDDLEEVEDLSMKSNSPANLSTARSSTDDDNAFVDPPKWVMCTDTSSIFSVPLPNDPLLWSTQQLQHWLLWAIKEFRVSSVSDAMWKMNGQQLCQLSLDEFREIVHVDNLNCLWNHIELLKKFRIFAIVDKPGARSSGTSLTPVKPSVEPALSATKVRTSSSSSSSSSGTATVNRRVMLNGHNGQIQLWQFLLELLGDRSKKSVIQWVGRDGEFKLCDPELVAKMWGERKNKPKMNYEKLSRALRYYYAEAMIAKVHGRRFVYKFVCNLKELVGCTTEELISMVEDDV